MQPSHLPGEDAAAPSARRKLLYSLNTFSQQKDNLKVKTEALHKAQKDHKEATDALQAEKRRVMSAVIKLAKIEISATVNQVQTKLPPEIRGMIYELCWDDESIEWAQDVFRFSRIYALDSRRSCKHRVGYRSYSTATHDRMAVLEDLALKEVEEQGTQHIRQLESRDVDKLECRRQMDHLGQQVSPEQVEGIPGAASHCIVPWLLCTHIVSLDAAQEVLQAFYRVNPCTFYVSPHELASYLCDDPFGLQLPPGQFLKSIAVGLSPVGYLDKNITADFERRFEKLHAVKLDAFELKIMLTPNVYLYEPGFDILQKTKALIDRFKKKSRKVTCIIICKHTLRNRCSEYRGYVFGSAGWIEEPIAVEPVVVNEVFEAPVEEWGRRLRELTTCTRCASRVDAERDLRGWTL